MNNNNKMHFKYSLCKCKLLLYDDQNAVSSLFFQSFSWGRTQRQGGKKTTSVIVYHVFRQSKINFWLDIWSLCVCVCANSVLLHPVFQEEYCLFLPYPLVRAKYCKLFVGRKSNTTMTGKNVLYLCHSNL